MQQNQNHLPAMKFKMLSCDLGPGMEYHGAPTCELCFDAAHRTVTQLSTCQIASAETMTRQAKGCQSPRQHKLSKCMLKSQVVVAAKNAKIECRA